MAGRQPAERLPVTAIPSIYVRRGKRGRHASMMPHGAGASQFEVPDWYLKLDVAICDLKFGGPAAALGARCAPYKLLLVTSPEDLIGASPKRKEDRRLITGVGRYVDDLSRPGLLHMAAARSRHAHARIVCARLDPEGVMPKLSVVS